MHSIVSSRREAVAEICRRYGVARLDVFGSAARSQSRREPRDVDLIVRFADPGAAGLLDRFFGLVEELEQLFGRPVDLLLDEPITNPYFAQDVAATRETVYERSVEEAPV